MSRFAILFFLLITAVIESAVPVHLVLISTLILLNFVQIEKLIWWLFAAGFILDLLLANFLGINFIILVLLLFSFYFVKNFLWPNLNYNIFPAQTIIIVSLEVIVASRLYEIFYNLVTFSLVKISFDLRLIPFEIGLTIVLFPVCQFLSLKFARQKQLEIKF